MWVRGWVWEWVGVGVSEADGQARGMTLCGASMLASMPALS